jgi:Tetracyclin repressor-like, C-terminal domain
MTDATGAEYEPAPPTGDWLADLIAFGEQARLIFRRHRWLAGLTMTRPVIGPNGTAQIEHFLTLLQEHPAGIEAKMEAFAMLNGITAAFALHNKQTTTCRHATSPTSATPSPPASTRA